MEVRTLPLGAAGDWYRRGWRNFRAQPGHWIALVLLYAVIVLAAQLVPLLGPVLITFLAPALTAGLLEAARQGEAGYAVELRHLFAGLRRPGSRLGLLVLGSLLLAWTLALVAAYLAAAAALSLDPGAPAPGRAAPPAAALAGLGLLAAGLAAALALFFAVPLVHFGRAPVFAALAASLLACLRNLPPLAVYGVSYAVLAFIAGLPYGLGLLVLAPVGAGANLAAFTDVFPRAGGSDGPPRGPDGA